MGRREMGGVVLASDAVHSYEEFECDRPFGIVCDVPAMYAAFDRVRELCARPGTHLVPGHDPAAMTRFGSGACGSTDLVATLL